MIILVEFVALDMENLGFVEPCRTLHQEFLHLETTIVGSLHLVNMLACGKEVVTPELWRLDYWIHWSEN